jgi:Alginate export
MSYQVNHYSRHSFKTVLRALFSSSVMGLCLNATADSVLAQQDSVVKPAQIYLQDYSSSPTDAVQETDESDNSPIGAPHSEIDDDTTSFVAAPIKTSHAAVTTMQAGMQASASSSNAAAKKKAEELQKKVATAHKPVYYNNDFSYILDPAYRGHQLGDNFKRRSFLGTGFYDIGGEYRLRQHSENNMRGLGLTGLDDDFLLRRTRLFGNFEFTKDIRVFGEMIDARDNFNNQAPRAIEVNEYDMLNLFIDARLWSEGDRSLSVKAGRQELLLGDQRLISPLDWANTRRTFDGYRATAKSKTLTVDGFYTNPVLVSEKSFDSPDLQQEFMGLYSSYTGSENKVLDLYALRYNNASGVNNFDFNTLGGRLNGSEGDKLYDLEISYQLGRNTDGSAHTAQSYTGGLGRKLNSASPLNPTLWVYMDWASGDNARGAGNGFHHLFPLAHRYNGFMDLFGRRNLGDANTFLSFKPSTKWTMLVWYHYFFLANQNDTPYSIVMRPFNPANAPGSRELGSELDLLGTYSISARQQLLVGYSHFWAGAYYDTTTGVPTNDDANFLYTQWSVAF